MALDSPTKKRYALVLAVVLLVGAGYAVYGATVANKKENPNAPVKLTKFTDEEAGFSVSYPKSWENLTDKSRDPLTRLLVGPPGVEDSVNVEVVPLPAPVVVNAGMPTEDAKALESSFDALIDRLPGLKEILDKSRVDVNGTGGWYYLYRFHDDKANKDGIHSRFFLFEKDTEYILTFQAFPADHYFELQDVFDQILKTFNFKLGRPSPRASGSPEASPSPSPSPAG